MKKRDKILLGGLIGIVMASSISSTYLYRVYKKFMRALRESLKDYNY